MKGQSLLQEVYRCELYTGDLFKRYCAKVKDKCNGCLIILTMKCQFFSLLWHSWMMQRAGMMNAEQFRLTDTFREFISFPYSQDKRALELSYHCSMRGFTVLPATPFTLLSKAFILIYWLWSFKNNCIWRKSAEERKSTVVLNNSLTLTQDFLPLSQFALSLVSVLSRHPLPSPLQS